jgi:hypothetical protein
MISHDSRLFAVQSNEFVHGFCAEWESCQPQGVGRMSELKFDKMYRRMVMLGAWTLAAAIIWRGQTFNSENQPNVMVPPVMCVLTGMILVLTGFAIGLRADDSQEPEA